MKVVVEQIQLWIFSHNHEIDEVLKDFRLIEVEHFLDDDFVKLYHAEEFVAVERWQKIVKVHNWEENFLVIHKSTEKANAKLTQIA